jgi:hypothetical protein
VSTPFTLLLAPAVPLHQTLDFIEDYDVSSSVVQERMRDLHAGNISGGHPVGSARRESMSPQTIRTPFGVPYDEEGGGEFGGSGFGPASGTMEGRSSFRRARSDRLSSLDDDVKHFDGYPASARRG